jgi:hypothetical protein
MSKTRSLVAAVIILACTPLLITSKGHKRVSTKEHANLVVQCRAIRDRIIRENNFELVKQQAIQQHRTQVAPSITERFTAMGGGKQSSGLQNAMDAAEKQLGQTLSAMEAQHNLRVIILIANTIDAYLKSVGTPAAMKLLSDLVAGNQVL